MWKFNYLDLRNHRNKRETMLETIYKPLCKFFLENNIKSPRTINWFGIKHPYEMQVKSGTNEDWRIYGNQVLICGVSVFMDSVSFLNLNPKQNIYSLNRGIMILISMNIKIIKSTNFRNQEFKLIHNIYFTMLDILV